GEGQYGRRLAGIAGQRRRDELVPVQLRPPDGSLLCRAARGLRDVLPDEQGSAHARRARRQRAGCRGIAWDLDHRDRLSDGKARMEVSLRGSRWRWYRLAHDGGRSAVRQRRVWESCRLWPTGEEVARASLARPYRLDRERRRDLHRGRPPIRARDR